MTIRPDPKNYKTWQKFASALVKTLDKVEERVVLKPPQFGVIDLPQANEDGMIAFVLDDVNGPQPVYSEGGLWRRFTDGTQTTT